MQAVEEIYCTLSEISEKLKVRYRTGYRWVQAEDLAAYRLKGVPDYGPRPERGSRAKDV